MKTNIFIHTAKGLTVLDVDNIIRIESKSNYSRIYFADGSFPLTVAKVLHWFEENLPPELFLRTHRTHLVNRQFISQVIPSSKLIHMSNGDKIFISRRRSQSVKKFLRA